jgi:hypothetical protein
MHGGQNIMAFYYLKLVADSFLDWWSKFKDIIRWYVEQTWYLEQTQYTVTARRR